MSKIPIYQLLNAGMRLELGSHQFEKQEILRFAERFDPQIFHVSEDGARDSIFGRLCASGWHTGSVWMRHNIDNFKQELTRLTNYEGSEPVIGPSPGLRNLRWPAPVYPGDTINFYSEITGKRTSARRPGWGIMMVRSYGVNQDEVEVLSMDGAVSIRLD